MRTLPPNTTSVYRGVSARATNDAIDEVGWSMQDADIDYRAELLGAAKVELIILVQTGASYFANDYDRQVKERIARVSDCDRAATSGKRPHLYRASIDGEARPGGIYYAGPPRQPFLALG
jgi:hypothetical protein